VVDNAVDPRTYCHDAIEELRRNPDARFPGKDGRQMIVVLAYYIQHEPSALDFPGQLKLLIQSAERSNRRSLAAAARAVLSDWETRSHITSFAHQTVGR
jgi:hypothetical protein